MGAPDLDPDVLREQAQRMREDMPELYSLLVRRDEAYQASIREWASSIPIPWRLPDLRPVFDGLFEVLKEDQSHDECKHWLEEPGEGEIDILGDEFRNRMYHVCRSAVVTKNTSLRTLAGDL